MTLPGGGTLPGGALLPGSGSSAPPPSISLFITPPGGTATDYTKYLAFTGAAQQASITQNFGRQGDNAILPLVDEYSGTPNVIIKAMSTVRLVDNLIGETIFAGLVTNPGLTPTGPNRNEWALNCTDDTFYADHALTRGTFSGVEAADMVVALTETANCGITAVRKKNGGFVVSAPQVDAKIGWRTLSDAWRTCANLAGKVIPYGWYVDENLALHFYDQARAASSGVTFTTTPTTAGSTTEGHIALDGSFSYDWDGTSLTNRWLVQGGTQTIKTNTSGNPQDTFRGDGSTTSWPLRYTLSGSSAQKITLNGVAEVVGSSGSGATFDVTQNNVGQWFLTTSTAPSNGAVIKLWYDYQFDIVVQVNDHASQAQYNGPNGGVFAGIIKDSSLLTAAAALRVAQRNRTEYAFPVERVSFTTTEDWMGWLRAGQTVTMNLGLIPDSQNNYALGVNDTFLVVQNTVTFTTGGYRQMQITAVRV